MKSLLRVIRQLLHPIIFLSRIDESDAIEIDSLDDSALGLYGPGEYEFQAEAEYAYAAVNNSDSFSLTSLSSFTKSINLGLTGEYIRVTSSIPDTNLKVNGEEVDFSMDSDSETPRFGPVSADITIQGTAPLPWGEAVKN
ncbi:TcaA 3rd/4th domain-containing protein [Gracilibacillus alcaliphilus]|uniref:TcaA 3rd/4th domain-containing protein n=1 Tax=Gracilibacillus alcaliphilus TaxID=1401441 RepID=UPI00195D9AF1|nr:hypothetical protein [Gracilibacillus alcaliphilus]MBM7677418.1 putative membrane protein YvbJ [Gracilibacillus alcaliphilus]